MVRHASSHGFSILMCTIIASFLVEILKPLVPGLMLHIKSLSRMLTAMFSIPLPVDVLTIVIIASMLGLIWGVFFKIAHEKK